MCRGTSQWSQIDSTRPFDTLEDMNSCIIGKINEYVNFDDELYIVGDFAFGDRSKIPVLRNRIICGKVHLIIGNHDYVDKYPQYYCVFDSIKHYHEIRYNKLLFCLFHYPLGSWNEIGKGAINTFGHCHSNYQRTIGRQIDVGWDALHRPISIEEVYNTMINIPIISTDHHCGETNYG